MPATGENRRRIAREYAARQRKKNKDKGLTTRGTEYQRVKFDDLDLIALTDPKVFEGRGLENGKWGELFTQERKEWDR